MKILLTAINAKYIHSNLAVYSLQAYCRQELLRQGYGAAVDIEIAEFTINNYIEDILTRIYREKPDILAFSCYIWNISMVEELVDLIHKVMPRLPIWLGGPEVSYDAKAVLRRNPAVQLVICGEGERTFSLLTAAAAKSLERGEADSPGSALKALAHIPGLVYRQAEDTFVSTGAAALLAMDELPFPYDELKLFEHKIIYYESSRGCPFSCSYCLSSIDKQVRFRSVAKVEAELLFFLEHKVPQVKFVDRTFNCRHDRTLQLWRFIRDHDNGVTNFHFEITADLLNEAELELLSTLRPGLVQLEIGVQSTNKETIAAIDRVMDFERLSQIVRRIHEGHNVHQHLDLIAGLPYEDKESFIRSFNDVYRLAPQQLQMGFLKVLKGSKMHRVHKDYALVYRTKPTYEVMSTRWLSFDDVLRLKSAEEMVEVYYNSGQFIYTLAYLLHFVATPFELFQKLADFYEKQGSAGQKYSRLDRYEMLRQFGENEVPGLYVEVLEDILIYDLYLRENIKSRPSWARDPGAYKAAIAAFYSDPAMREKYFGVYDALSYRQVRGKTHVEIFEYDVLEAAATGAVHRRRHGVLFDYEHRDSLTYEGRAIDLEGDIHA